MRTQFLEERDGADLKGGEALGDGIAVSSFSLAISAKYLNESFVYKLGSAFAINARWPRSC